jgi:hypothetical protein
MSNIKVTQAKVENYKVSSNYKMKYEVDEFNNYQNKLYKEALFGISNYTQEEIKKLSYQEQNRIVKANRKAQSVLNIWKQELCNNIINSLFKKLFPNSPVTKELTEEFGNVVDASYKNFLTFKQLGVSKKEIVYKLIKHDVLPKNFFELV